MDSEGYEGDIQDPVENYRQDHLSRSPGAAFADTGWRSSASRGSQEFPRLGSGPARAGPGRQEQHRGCRPRPGQGIFKCFDLKNLKDLKAKPWLSTCLQVMLCGCTLGKPFLLLWLASSAQIKRR